MVPDVSPSMSFKGWALTVWLVKNKGYVKTVLSAYLAILGVFSLADAASHLVEIGGATLLAALLILAKFGIDAVDFFVSDVDLGS